MTHPAGAPTRYPQLDALRGIAALAVVLFHVFPETLPSTSSAGHLLHLLDLTPLHLLWAGHEAVIVFFVLSGFVLALMLNRPMRYRDYALKRLTRLYIPYAVAILAAAALGAALGGPLPGVSPWAAQFWTGPVSMHSVLHHLLFIGTFDTTRLDFVIWSLVHEMRISLVFPLLPLALTRWGARRVLWGVAALGVLAQLGVLLHLSSLISDWLHTLGYLLPFVVGAVLATYRQTLTEWSWRFRTRQLLWVWLTALLLLCYGGRVLAHVRGDWSVLSDWPLTLGAALVIGLLVSRRRAAAAIQSPATAWLGLISYSLYLWHPVVLLTALHLLAGWVPLLPLLGGVLVVSLLAGWVSFSLLERPSITWARGIGRHVQPAQGAATD